MKNRLHSILSVGRGIVEGAATTGDVFSYPRNSVAGTQTEADSGNGKDKECFHNILF